MKKVYLIAAILLYTLSMNAQELIVISSDNLKCNDSILVFTPKEKTECASCGNCSLPTLFLLHGWSGCYKDWSTRCDIQNVCDQYGFRIICPDGFYNSWYADNVDKEKMQWVKFFDEELYPQLKERFKLDPEKTFITGLSMGGHGAINIFMDNPDRFAAAGSMSGVLDLYHTTLLESQVSKILGSLPENKELYDERNAILRLPKMVGSEKIMIVSCGYEDYYAKSTIAFADKCRELKIPHISILTPGNHSWKYWDFALGLHLDLFTRILNGENLGY